MAAPTDKAAPPAGRRVHITAKGGTLYPWMPGQSGNPGGWPKGFVRPSQAYAKVSTLPLADVRGLLRGKAPKGWATPVSSVYVLAAGQFLAAIGGKSEDGVHKANASSAIEIGDRTEGKVAQTHVVELHEAAKALAEKLGCTPEELLRDAAALAAGTTK